MRSADLSGADLTGAELKGADLQGANLTKADLIRANLTGTSLKDAITNRDTILTGIIRRTAAMGIKDEEWNRPKRRSAQRPKAPKSREKNVQPSKGIEDSYKQLKSQERLRKMEDEIRRMIQGN